MYRHDDYVDGIALVNEGKVHLRPLLRLLLLKII